jgi:hypothetical protein
VMSAKFVEGDRIVVSQEFFWAKAATGTIRKPPSEVIQIGGAWNGLTRTEKSALGEHTVYWVEFDEPQRDADGDGPYRAGCIHENSLSLLSRVSN